MGWLKLPHFGQKSPEYCILLCRSQLNGFGGVDYLQVLKWMSRTSVVTFFLIVSTISLPLLVAERPFQGGVPLGQGPFAKMSMLYQRTFLRVDVMTLEIHFGPAVASQLEGLAAGTKLTPSVEDSIADIALQAQNAKIHVKFRRNFSTDRFFKEALDNTSQVLKAGLIKKEFYEEICRQLPIWYSFMNNRGVIKGDEMFHLIKGDTLRSIYRGANGEVLMDETQVGQERRLAILGSYLVEKSDFRKGLIESLFAY